MPFVLPLPGFHWTFSEALEPLHKWDLATGSLYHPLWPPHAAVILDFIILHLDPSPINYPPPPYQRTILT